MNDAHADVSPTGDAETLTDSPEIAVSVDGETTLPLDELVTGRSFLTGKSGSGKSSSASVVIEEMLRRGLPMLIVDPDGEYVGLKAEFKNVLHAGASPDCDVQIDTNDARTLARTALCERVPVVLDTSEFFDEETAKELVADVVRELFILEKREQFPFLVVLEECHEYIPERGGEHKDVFIKAAKRGRSRGLGVCALSQRPADVAKAFITQCDLLVFHRLTWPNDTDVVANVLGGDYGELVEELDTGEAIARADWTDGVERFTWRRKDTPDLGAAPAIVDALGSTPERLDGDVLAAFDVELSDQDGDELPASARQYVADLASELEELNDREREMLDAYRRLRQHDDAPDAGHVGTVFGVLSDSWGSTYANKIVRVLRERGYVTKTTAGVYRYSVDDRARRQLEYNPRVSDGDIDTVVASVEHVFAGAADDAPATGGEFDPMAVAEHGDDGKQ